MATKRSKWRRRSWAAPSITSGRMAVSARSVIQKMSARRGWRRLSVAVARRWLASPDSARSWASDSMSWRRWAAPRPGKGAAERPRHRPAGPHDRRNRAPVAPARRRWCRRSRAWSEHRGLVRTGILDGLGANRHTGTHQAAAIEHNPDGLAALALVLAGDGAAAAGGGCPADVAQVIALSVLAQALEVATQSPLPRRRSWSSIWRLRARKICCSSPARRAG